MRLAVFLLLPAFLMRVHSAKSDSTQIQDFWSTSAYEETAAKTNLTSTEFTIKSSVTNLQDKPPPVDQGRFLMDGVHTLKYDAMTLMLLIVGSYAVWLVGSVQDGAWDDGFASGRTLLLVSGSLLLYLGYTLSHDRGTVIPGARIPHAKGTAAGSTVSSIGIGLLGISFSQQNLMQNFFNLRCNLAKMLHFLGPEPDSTLSFEAWFFRRSFIGHIVLNLWMSANWARASTESQCVGYLGGEIVCACSVFMMACRLGLHCMQDHCGAEELVRWLCPASTVLAFIAILAKLLINIDDDGLIRCPGEDDPVEVANSYVTLAVLWPMQSSGVGLYIGLNGAGATKTLKIVHAVCYLQGIVALAKFTVHDGAMSLSTHGHTDQTHSVLFCLCASFSGLLFGWGMSHLVLLRKYREYLTVITGVADEGADSRCQLGTGTGMGAHSDLDENHMLDLTFTWDELEVDIESHSENVSQTSDVATSSNASTEAASSPTDEEDDAIQRPRKLPRFKTEPDMGSDKDTSPSEFLVNSCSGTITSVAVLDPKRNIVMSNGNFVHLCSQVGYGNTKTGLVHLQDLVSDAVTELLWRKSCLQPWVNFNKASDCVHIEGTMSYVVQDDTILWTTCSYTMLSSYQRTAPSNCTQGVNPDRALVATSAPTAEDAMATIEHAMAIAVSTYIPGEAAPDSTQHAKGNALGISDDWIDGLAAGAPLSWEKFRFDQQNISRQIAKRKTAHTNSASERWASEVEDASLRDQLLDALEANPSDQKVDMLLETFISKDKVVE